MKNSKKQIIGGLLVALIAIAVLYLSGANLRRSSSASIAMIDKDINKPKKIERLISHAKMTQLFKKANSSDLQVNLYPIKHSDDPKKNDFDLAVFYSDKAHGLIGQELNMSVKDFWTMSNNYVRYIKGKKKSYHQLPNGYELHVYRYQLGAKGDIVFSVSPEDQNTTIKIDSCRKPPGCAIILPTPVLLLSDSCRNPPGCTI